jgi:hypothetical protein
MGGISEAQVEWAVVNRLKAMLDDPPETKFNVTQTFSLFTTILLWTKNRAWVAGNRPGPIVHADVADQQAQAVRDAFRTVRITADPWRLPLVQPKLQLVDEADIAWGEGRAINGDFVDMTAEDFLKWLRDALAHGDGRTIHPIHKRSERTGVEYLAGFKVEFNKLKLHLFNDDMQRIGREIADIFCHSLSGGDQRYFEQETGTARLAEISQVA